MIVPYYRSNNRDFTLLHGDSFELLPQFEFKFDMIFVSTKGIGTKVELQKKSSDSTITG